MISKFQMSHLLHFMKKNPSLSKNKVLKGHSYRCLWQSLADWLNYLAQSDKNFLKTTDEWIQVRKNMKLIVKINCLLILPLPSLQFWDELNLSVQRKVFAFIDLEDNEKVVLDILCSEVHVPEYLMEEVSAADDDGVVEIPNEYLYHDGIFNK